MVFGTKVMITVAKNLDAPLKIIVPRSYSLVNLPDNLIFKMMPGLYNHPGHVFSMLGLGDIAIPGVFTALCLRFDFFKSLNPDLIDKIIEEEKSGEENDDDNGAVAFRLIDYLLMKAYKCPKHYFIAA